MRLLDRIADRLGYTRRAAPLAKAHVAHQHEIGAPSWSMQTLMEMMVSSHIVHTAVRLVAQSFASAALQVVDAPGKSGKPVDNHPFVELVMAPNPLMAGFELLEETAQSLELAGNAYWYFVPDEIGGIAEIYLLRADRVGIRLGTPNIVSGYVYMVNGHRLEIPADFVTHFKYPHPLDDFFGLSPLQAAFLELVTDKAMAVYEHGFFSHKVAKDDGLLILPSYLDDTRYDEIVEMMTGEDRQRGTMILRAGVDGEEVQWHKRSASRKDMEFVVGRGFIRQVVLETLGIPTGMMSEASTEAHARVAERRFLNNIYHRHIRFASRITRDVLPLYGSGLYARFDDVRIADAEQVRAKQEAMAPVATVNEQREELNLAPREGGDELHQPANEDQNGGQETAKGPRQELATFRRWARARQDPDLGSFEFGAIGTETRSEILAACSVADPETIDQVILSFYGRTSHELAR